MQIREDAVFSTRRRGGTNTSITKSNMDKTVENPLQDDNKTEHDASFSQVGHVVTDWMLDFLFVSLCRNFKDGNVEEFNKNMNSFEVLSDGLPQSEKVLIAAFLGRVIHGKDLDVFFEEDSKVMPLMSALKIWTTLKENVVNAVLAKNLTVLLFVQSVAVCLETGSKAAFVIQWLENNIDFPSETLKARLNTVVEQKDNYHPLIMSFSFSRLLETTQEFLDSFLEKNPSDFLLKAGAKAVREDAGPKDDIQPSPIEADKENQESTLCLRSKRKLHSNKILDYFTPEPCRKSVVCLTRIPKREVPNDDTMTTTEARGTRRPRTKWTWTEDKCLIKGVKRHGLGHWSRILLDYDFGERTGTMLKDRWRTLRKLNSV